jgi:hypothetical protein
LYQILFPTKVGCVVWDAALVLGAYLDHMNQTDQKPLKNLKILELGSGTGFVGLVAAAIGYVICSCCMILYGFLLKKANMFYFYPEGIV